MAAKKKSTVTLDALLTKKRRTKELAFGDSGGTILFQALGAKGYDTLIAECPPTKEQKSEGANWNPDTFGPALIAACAVEPAITREDADALWASESWSRGELMNVFMTVVELNSEGLDVPFNATG